MIKRGTTIYQEEPFAYVLHKIHSNQRCDNCFKRCKVQICSGCTFVGYCGVSCQTLAFPVHRTECLLLKRINGQFLDDVRLVARIITKLKDGGVNLRQYYNRNEYRTFYDMISHEEEIQNDKERMDEFEELYANLTIFIGNEMVPTRGEVFEIFTRLIINSYYINSGPYNNIGTGIYLAISILDHSCIPNLIYIHDGPKMILTAVEDIAELNWKQMTVPYIIVSERTEKRKELLQKNYYFACRCSKCESPEYEAACPDPFCTNSCKPDGKYCTKCNKPIPHTMTKKYNSIMKQSNELLELKEFNDYSVIKKCLINQNDLLHAANSIHLKVLKKAYDYVRKESLWKEAEIYLKKLIAGYSKHYTLLNFSYILMHLDLARAYFEQKELEKCVYVLIKVKTPLHIIYASNVSNILYELKELFPREILTMLK